MTTEALKQARDVLHALCEALADGDTTSAEQIARGSGTSAIAALDAAIAQEAADREDAERYAYAKTLEGQVVVMETLKSLGAAHLDQALDEAMAEEDAARAKEKSRG